VSDSTVGRCVRTFCIGTNPIRLLALSQVPTRTARVRDALGGVSQSSKLGRRRAFCQGRKRPLTKTVPTDTECRQRTRRISADVHSEETSMNRPRIVGAAGGSYVYRRGRFRCLSFAGSSTTNGRSAPSPAAVIVNCRTGRDRSLPVLFDSSRDAAAVAAGGTCRARLHWPLSPSNVLSARGSGARSLPAKPRFEASNVARVLRALPCRAKGGSVDTHGTAAD
jgi:hypothetical protein